MPITYSIDREAGIIRAWWQGDIDADELSKHWTTLMADREALAVHRTLVDVRGANLLFTGMEMAALIDSIITPGIKGLEWKAAIVVSSAAQYGVSRQYQAFAAHYSDDAIFTDPELALEWLSRQ